MFGGNFQTWKLHSAQDYFMFFAYILAGVLVFWLIAKHMNKQRNHEKAVEKVSGRVVLYHKVYKILVCTCRHNLRINAALIKPPAKHIALCL